ncbi:hypothetical protein PbB2_02733 [Candidatus Phycosocius bacilliformis]|uniref:Uncharacterized protein n=1 Tax=Candidatus Phycosocius bacilliformis TaxID=1445552 RepID=A0A2P2EDD2_9PROT|nr:hypothetical protein PbB2_02733 [Candidatus Phycosocius bacilliformis]
MNVVKPGAIEVTDMAEYNAITFLIGLCIWTIGLMVATIWAAISSRE